MGMLLTAFSLDLLDVEEAEGALVGVAEGAKRAMRSEAMVVGV